MTLIAAFKCSDGFVLCADSQETAGPYRVARQKIDAETWGNFQVSIAGTGHGDVIDACVDKLSVAVRASNASTLSELQRLLHLELLEFSRKEATVYPRKDRAPRFIVAARPIQSRAVEVWRTAASRLIPITTYALIGWEEPIYEHAVQRLYRSSLTVGQARIVGMYVFVLAGNTSNYVGGPTSVVLALPHAIVLDRNEAVRELQERVKRFSQTIDALLLSCADIGLPASQFDEQLNAFLSTARQLRVSDFEHGVRDVLTRGLNAINDPYPGVPPGSSIMIEPDGRVYASDTFEGLSDLLKTARDKPKDSSG